MSTQTLGKYTLTLCFIAVIAVIAYLALTAPDRRSGGEKIGDAIDELGDRSLGERIGDDLKKQ